MADTDTHATADPSVTDLVERITEQSARLVRDEFSLAKAEMLAKAGRAGMGAALLSGAGVLAAVGGGTVLAAIIAAISTALPVWASALIVGGAMFAGGGVLAIAGRHKLRQAQPMMPERPSERIKADAHVIAEQVRK